MLAQREIFNSDRYKQIITTGIFEGRSIEQMKTPIDLKVFSWDGEKNKTISHSILYYIFCHVADQGWFRWKQNQVLLKPGSEA